MDQEWEKLKEALGKAPTEEARKEAAEAFRRYTAAKLAEGKGSKPTLVWLRLGEGRHEIPLENIPDKLEKDPQFFELMKRIVK